MIKQTSNMKKSKEIEQFYNVCSIYSEINNETIVPFIGYCEDTETEITTYSIITEFMPNYSLERMFHQNKILERWDFTCKIIFIFGVAYGLNYLHNELNVLHTNLNFSNILISDKWEPKITDIMFSTILPIEFGKLSDDRLIFIAPEILEGQPFSKESDIYSFGIFAIMIMMENMMIINGNPTGEDLIKRIKSGLLRSLPKCIPTCIHEVLLNLISVDPTKRPSIPDFLEILQSFFNVFEEDEKFEPQIFNDYKNKITAQEDKMDEECKQIKLDADAGDSEAMYRYAHKRMKGIGCTKNEAEAMRYYKKSAENGYEKAISFLNGSESKKMPVIPETITIAEKKININKLNELKERLRNKKSGGTVVSEEKNLISIQNIKLSSEDLDAFQEFSRLANDKSFNEDPMNTLQVTKEIKNLIEKRNEKLPTEADRKKIKKSNFILTEQSESRLYKILNYIKYRVPVLLEGPTGTSKTLSSEIACQILNDLKDEDKQKYEFVTDETGKIQIELIRFNLSSETKTKDLIGRYVGDPNSWAGISQEDGAFYKAFKYGKILLLDEINLASPAVLQCIEEALDSRILSIEIPGKPLIPIPMHKNFRLIATQNPNKGLFAHKRQDLGLKFYSRFQVINFPSFTSEELGEIALKLAKQFDYHNEIVIKQLVSFHKEWSENPDIQDDAQCFTIREMAATVRALSDGGNVYDTIMTIYGARYQEKKRNQLINVLKKYKKLNVKGEEFLIPDDFSDCYQNESLKRTVKSALFSLINGRNIIITGKEGCGKTQVALWISNYFNTVIRKEILKKTKNLDKSLLTKVDVFKQCYCICTEDTKVADLVGHQSPAGKAEAGDEIIKWISGFLTDAIKEGKCCVLESIDEAPATVTERLNGLLDQKYDNQVRYFDIPENPKEKKIAITDSFRILATCDIEEIGFISPAFLNRFDIIVLEDQITPDSDKKEFNDLTDILLAKFYNEARQNKKKLGESVSRTNYAVTTEESQKISLTFRDHPEVWNNILKISKACKSVSTFLLEFKETSKNKRETIIDFAINLLSGDRTYQIPIEIENRLLEKLQEDRANSKNENKSTDPEFYFRKSALLCTFMAKLMAFSLIQQPVCVSGPTGAGKTSAARKFARMRSCHSKSRSQFQMHSFHAGTKTSQFYGTATLANGQIDFIEGTLTTALKNGDVFIADEFNLSPQSVMKSLAPALEQTVGTNIFIPGIDESINISTEFFFIACQNELGTLGRNAIPDTISPRFAYLDYPKPELKDLQTICEEIAKEKEDDEEESCINVEIATKIAEYMQDINSISSPYITPWSLRDISKIFRRIRFQQNKYNINNYIGIDNYHHIYFYTLSSVPQKDVDKAIDQIKSFFEKFSPDDQVFELKYRNDFKARPIIEQKENGYFIMKGEIGVRINTILLNMLKESFIQNDKNFEEDFQHKDDSHEEESNDFFLNDSNLEFLELPNFWNTAFQICLSDNREPLLLMGNSGFKTFLAQQINQNASIISLNQETTVAQLLGSSGFFTSSEAKHFYINNLCNICFSSFNERIGKLRELQDKWEKGTLTKKDIDPIVQIGLNNNPQSFKYMIEHLSEKIFSYTDEEKCVLSNTTLEFRPGLFLNAILQKKSLILKDLSNLPTIVLERFNELFSGKQNITLTEDIHNTFTDQDQKELTEFNNSFRVIGTCPANTPSKLSEAVLSRFTVIATPEYDNDERKIVLTSLCQINKFNFQVEDIQLLLDVSKQIEDEKLKPYTFAQMIKTVQLTSMINNLNPDQPRYNLAIAIFRLLSGFENKEKKNILFDIIKKKISPDFQEIFIKNEAGKCPLEYIGEESSNKGINSIFTHLLICEPKSHEYDYGISKKNIAYTSHFCDILDAIHLSIAIHNPIILEGPPGQGKHTAIEYIANMLNSDVIYITISQSTKVDDLLGKLKIERKKDGIHVEFTKSKLVETISFDSGVIDKPIIVIENINNATPAVLNALLSIFNVEIKDILLPSGETMKKGEFNLIGIFNTQQSTSTRDKLPSSLINSSIYYVVKDPNSNEIEKVIKEEFIEKELETESDYFYQQFLKAKNFLFDNHLPKIFTLNDISKYLLFRKKTKAVFPNSATIMQMIFVYRFFQESQIEQIRKELGYEIMTFMPSFTYDNTKSYLLVRVADDQKVLSIPLIKPDDLENSTFNYDKTITKIDSLTSTQKYCLIFMACALLSKRACVIQGDTSSGKSFLIRLFAELIGAKLNVFQMNTDSSVSMLAGQSVLSEKPSEEDTKVFQDYLETLSKIEEINKYLEKNEISKDKPNDWSPKKFTEMLKYAEEVVETTESSFKDDVVETIKNFRELMSPVHRFDNKESELIRAMREGEWVLIDGIESAPPEIAEKIASLCGENPELNLFECGPEFIFSKANGKIHENFQLFITYNPMSSKNNQSIDQSFLIKSVSFTLPVVDYSDETSAQIIFGTMLNQHYPIQQAKEVSSRLGIMHHAAKLESISKIDSFAGDIQFTGRTLKFITEVFKYFNKHEQGQSISKPIAFLIQAFYLNSVIDIKYLPEFKLKLLLEFQKDPTDLVKTLEQNQKNLRQRNYFVLLTLRNIQLYILKDEKLKYDFNKFINDCNSIQTSDVSFIIRHIEDTISIIKENPRENNDLDLKFGSLIIIIKLLKQISDALQKTFKVEHSCLKLNEKELKTEKNLSKSLSQLYMITILSNHSINPRSSLLLNSILYEEILSLTENIAKNRKKKYIISLIQYAINKPHSIDFINAIFPGHIFVGTEMDNVNFVLPIILKCIDKKVSFKLYYKDDKYIENETAEYLYLELHINEKGNFNICKKTKLYFDESEKPLKFYTKNKNKAKDNHMFYNMLNLMFNKNKTPIRLTRKEVKEYWKTASDLYNQDNKLKYDKITRLSDFFEKSDVKQNMVYYAWNLITSLDAKLLSAISQVVNPLESYILDILNYLYDNSTFEVYKYIIEFSNWITDFDDKLPILLKVVSNIEIANTKNKQVELDLIERIEEEKKFLEKIPKTPFKKWNSRHFIDQLDSAEKSILELSKELKKKKKIQDDMKKLRDELQNSNEFYENDEFRLGLIDQIDNLDVTQENLTMLQKKVRQLKESIYKNSLKEEKNKIVWPTLSFPNDKYIEDDDLQKFKILMDYSRVYYILNKLKTAKNKIKYLPGLNSYKSMSASIPSLFDYYIKHDDYPKDLIDIAIHELNVTFLSQLLKIDKNKIQNINETSYKNYTNFYEYYKIPEIFNNRIDRKNVTEDELKAIFDFSLLIPENLEFALPNITPNDMIYFFIVKATKNGKDEIKPGPLLKEIPPQKEEMEQFSPLLDVEYNNYLEAVSDIARIAYKVFKPDRTCPKTTSDISKDIFKVLKTFVGQSAARNVFNQIKIMFEFAIYGIRFTMDQNNIRSNYQFRFDDLVFLNYDVSNQVNWASMVIREYPSFALWGLKNGHLINQIVHTYRDLRPTIEKNIYRLPFWLHCLRIFSSTRCIEFIPKRRNQLKKIENDVNEVMFKQISEKLDDPMNIGTDWLNLLIPNVPTDFSNQFIHMIYLLLQSICKDQKMNHKDEIIDKLCETISQIISFTFNNQINDYYDSPLPDNIDNTLISFFKNPANYIIGQIEENFKKKCNSFILSERVGDLTNYIINSIHDNRNYIIEIQNAIKKDKSKYYDYLVCMHRHYKDRKLFEIKNQLNMHMNNYTHYMRSAKSNPSYKNYYKNQIEFYTSKLIEFNVKIKEDYEIDQKQDFDKLVNEYRLKWNKYELENFRLFIAGRSRNFTEQEFLDIMNQAAIYAENFGKYFINYIQKGQIDDGEKFLMNYRIFLLNIVNSQRSIIINNFDLPNCMEVLRKIRPHYNQLIKLIDNVRNEIATTLHKINTSKGSNFDPLHIFQNSYEIVYPERIMTRKIDSSKAKYFTIGKKDSFELPVISMSNKGELKCNVNIIKCIIKPIIPSLYSENITISLISLIDEPITCELDYEPKEKGQISISKNVDPRNPIQILSKIPSNKTDECQVLDFKGNINLTCSTKSLKLPFRLIYQLIPMKVKLYCKHYKLSDTVSSFRVCCKEFFSEDSAKIFVSNKFDSDTKISTYSFETEADNEADKPIFDIKYTKKLPKRPYVNVLMQSSSPKKLHFTLKVAMSQNLIANILFNCTIVPFKFFLEVYDFKLKTFVSNNIEILWAPKEMTQKMYCRIMCPCIPKKVYTKVFFNLPTGIEIRKIEGLGEPSTIPKRTLNSFSCCQEFTNNFIFTVIYECKGNCPSSNLLNNKNKYSISAIFSRKQKDLDKLLNNNGNKVSINFINYPRAMIDERNKMIKFSETKSSGDIPIHVYDYKKQNFIRYKKTMKINDYSGNNKPLIFVTPFESVSQTRNQTTIIYQKNNVVVNSKSNDVAVYYLKLGTDGSLMSRANTPNNEIKNSLTIPNLYDGLKFLNLMAGAFVNCISQEKASIKYTIVGELDSEPSIWFPAFSQYPYLPKKLDVIPQNVKTAESYINRELRSLLAIPTIDARKMIDYKALLEKISKREAYPNTNFGIFMLIMLDKSNLKKVSELISVMPNDFKDRCPEITKYIPSESAFKEEEDLLIIYSYNIISEFSRIFEQRYKEIVFNKNSLVSHISQDKIDDARSKAYFEFYDFDTRNQFILKDVSSPNFKAHEEYKEYTQNVIIQPLPADKFQHECYLLCENNEPVPDNKINEIIDPKWNIPDNKINEKGNKKNSYIENPPEIKIPNVFTIKSLNLFYYTCSQAASVLPAFLSNSKDNSQALQMFIALLDIYKQFHNADTDFSIISESANSFINSFNACVCRLKNAKVEFNFLSPEETNIIDNIKTSNKSSEWISMPNPDPVSLTSVPWKTKADNARDIVKEAAIIVDVQNNLNLENDFQTQNTIFSIDTLENNEDEEKPKEELPAEENVNEDIDFIIKRFAIDDSDDLENKDLSDDDDKEINDDGDIKVIKNIGKVTKKNLNQGKAADSMLSKLKENDGIERVISRIHSMDPSRIFTFKNTQPDNRITDEALLQTDKINFPITKFISNASNLICLLVSNASDNKIVRASNFSYPYELLSVNLLIDCSSYIPESNKMFNVLLLTSFAYALNFLHVPYEICVVADQKFRFILKPFEEPHSIKALQRVLDCVLIQRYRTNYPDTFHHTVEFMNNPDEKRTQRAVFLFSDGLDENLVLIDAWNKQVLNNSAISYGILVTLPQSLSKDNKIEMENVWNQFADGTKGAVSITRISVFESNLNRPANTQKIVNCFKDVISRAISIQSTYEPSEDPKPTFDFNIPDLSTNSYKSFDSEIKTGSKFFVSIEKSAPLTSNKIHIDKLDISYYRGKTSKIIQCNVDKANHDNFVSFIHRLTTRQKNIFRSQLETIFKPNKASQTVLSNTGTDFDITALVLNLINPVPDPFIYLEEKGGLIRNYGVTVVIDTSVSCFNFVGSMHSVKTVINVLCALSSVEIPCVDVILSTQNEPIVLCSEVPSIHALGEKSSIWPALFSYILQPANLGESKLEAGIHAAYDLRRMRGIDYSSILFVLTDGLYMAERKKKIKEHVMASIQLGINVVGVGIGIYPVGITDIFPQSVFAPNPNEIVRAISCCFGDDNPDPLEKIIPLFPDLPPNDSFLEIFNKFKDYDQNPVFSDLKEKLKRIPAAIDAFSDVYNEEQDFKGKSYKELSNPTGNNTEMYIKNILEGQKILIVMLYSADYNLEENPRVDKKYLDKNPDPSKDECVRKAVAFFGIDIVVVEEYDSAMDELMKRENDKCVYYAVWVISGWKYEDNPYNYNAHHVIAFTQCLLQFWKSGGSVVLLAEGEPLTFQANYFLEQLTFPDGSKTPLRLHGSHKGGEILYGDDEGTLSQNKTFNRSNLEFKKCQRSSIAHNLVKIYEGETISYADDDPEAYKPFIPFSKDSEGGISALFYPFDTEYDTGDIFIDCGYTKLFDKMTEDGTFKYIQNIAGWTARVENSLTNHIKPKDYRPKGFVFNRDEFINMKYKFDIPPDDLYKGDDDGFDIDIGEMKTLFAIDYSGSVYHSSYYHSIVANIFNEKYKEGDLIMIWTDYAKFIDYEEMRRIWTQQEGDSGTYPSKIIELILNTHPPIDTEHLVLVTDGYIYEKDVENCIKLVEANDIKFKMVDTYIIGETGDQSVGTIFQKDSPSTTYIYKPSLNEPEIEVVSKKDIRVFGKLDTIDNLAKFESNFESLFKVIKTKMMGKDSNKELEAKLIEMQKKIIESEGGEVPSDFNRKIKALIQMSQGRIKGIFNNKAITAMLK